MKTVNCSVLLQAGFDNGITSAITHVKQAGFDSVMLTLNSNLQNKDIKKVTNIGLHVDALHLPYNVPFKLINTLWTCDAHDAMTILCQGVDLAVENKIPAVIVHASSGFNPPELNELGVHNYAHLSEYAKQHNVVVAIENIKRFDYVEYLMERIPSDNVKLCLDIGHANAYSHNLYSYDWDKLLDRLYCVHIHDNDGERDLHLMPGMGNIDWNFVGRLLKRAPNLASVMVETYYCDRETYYPNKFSEGEFFQAAAESTKKFICVGDANEE
ncbi:MAG: sugar phosphate isomerase/epimerase [Clostridiales bacterium]|nr:sugar phosphate isomerase/epimerase [Clostridiales bacterium]